MVTSRFPRRKSFLLMILLLLGAVGWFSPTLASTRRLRKTDRSSVASPREIVVPVSASAGELCVRGTSISHSASVAVIDGQVVAVGQRILSAGKSLIVVSIEPEAVRLREISSPDEPQSAESHSQSLHR